VTDDGVTPAKWNFRVGSNFVGPYSPFDEPGVVLGSYGLMHLSGRVRLNRGVVFDGGIRNVLDRAYPELVAGHIVAPGSPGRLTSVSGTAYRMKTGSGKREERNLMSIH